MEVVVWILVVGVSAFGCWINFVFSGNIDNLFGILPFNK